MISMRSGSLRAPAGPAGARAKHALTYIYGFLDSTSTRAKTRADFFWTPACVRARASAAAGRGCDGGKEEVLVSIREGLKWERMSTD